ncbi:MAG TPA: DUF11 domain-containing protein [Thermoanaerobaculia bacterium]|nr:DUF11 domain-containing protein [Thermoanaerobaculia bacterium]
MKRYWVACAFLLFAHAAFADITLTDRGSTLQHLKQNPADKASDRAAEIAANAAKRAAKRARHAHSSGKLTVESFHPAITATGSIGLVDAGGLKYFINTDITFSTSSSASGAASEASYTHAIAASTIAGGTVMSTLNDMFDGYNALCVSLTNSTGPCRTGDANFVIYNKNGPASIDTSVPAVPECISRQFVLPAKAIGGLSVQRKVYVPTNDRFIRWMNFFTNTTGSPITFTMVTSNNLGSDNNTIVVTTSSGDAVVTTGDLWATSFQQFSGSTSSDPRIGHVFQGSGAPTPVANINFVNGDDNPYWVYSITLNPGQTKIIVNYATGQGTKAAAAAQAANLAAFGPNAQQCMSATELSEVTNFQTGRADLSITKTSNLASPPVAFGGGQAPYTLAVTNNGPTAASSVSVTDPLPAGSGFVSATGSGWTCGFASGVVTCTTSTLAVGPAAPITLVITAPPVTKSEMIPNTATVSSATSDPVPGNNSSTTTIHVVPGKGPGH